MKEDVVEIILNLKALRIAFSEEPVKIFESLRETSVTESFEANSAVEIVNPDHVICTLTDKKASIEMVTMVRLADTEPRKIEPRKN